MKNYIRKPLVVAPWLILTGLAVYFGSQALAQWHYNEFTKPFVVEQTSQKLSK